MGRHGNDDAARRTVARVVLFEHTAVTRADGSPVPLTAFIADGPRGKDALFNGGR